MRLIAASLVAGALAAPVLAQTVPPTALGACSTCHGADLAGSGAVPSLRDRDAAELQKTLAEFKAGSRPATVMTRLVKGYSDAEIEAVARAIAALDRGARK
jgi:cytochrome subunit of sulfide dehydrogenase